MIKSKILILPYRLMDFYFQEKMRIEQEKDEYEYLANKISICKNFIDSNTLILFLTTEYYSSTKVKNSFIKTFTDRYSKGILTKYHFAIIYAFSESDIKKLKVAHDLKLYLFDESIPYFSPQLIDILKSKTKEITLVNNDELKEIKDPALLLDIIKHVGANNFVNIKLSGSTNYLNTLNITYPTAVEDIIRTYRQGYNLILLKTVDDHFIVNIISELMRSLNALVTRISAKNYKNVLNYILKDDSHYVIEGINDLSIELQVEFWRSIKSVKNKLMLISSSSDRIEIPFPSLIKDIHLQDFSKLQSDYPDILASFLVKHQVITRSTAKLISSVGFFREFLDVCPNFTVLDQAIKEAKDLTKTSLLNYYSNGDQDFISHRMTYFLYNLKRIIIVLSDKHLMLNSKDGKQELEKEPISFELSEHGKYLINAPEFSNLEPVRKTNYLIGVLCLIKYYQIRAGVGPISAFHLRNLMIRYEAKKEWKETLVKRFKNIKILSDDDAYYLSAILHPALKDSYLKKIFGKKIEEFGIRNSKTDVYLDNYNKFNFIISDANLNSEWFTSDPNDITALLNN